MCSRLQLLLPLHVVAENLVAIGVEDEEEATKANEVGDRSKRSKAPRTTYDGGNLITFVQRRVFPSDGLEVKPS